MKMGVFSGVILASMLLLLSSALSSTDFHTCNIVIEPLWLDLEKDPAKTSLFGGKWVLVGSITFEKKVKETLHLQRMLLQWNGNMLNTLCGSLYRKIPDKVFYPIEDNLIADGVWSKAKQTLTLTFSEQEQLGLRNIFYLVLTIPTELEPLVKKGNFELLTDTLPEAFRQGPHKNFLLALDQTKPFTPSDKLRVQG